MKSLESGLTRHKSLVLFAAFTAAGLGCFWVAEAPVLTPDGVDFSFLIVSFVSFVSFLHMVLKSVSRYMHLGWTFMT